MNCKECIHFEVCAYVSHYLQACDSYEEHVQHGRWDENGRCTNCGGHAPYWSMASTYYESPYCPNCGSKMVGKAGEQE